MTDLEAIHVTMDILKVDRESAENYLWNHTGWPCFFDRKHGKDQKECLTNQLRQMRVQMDAWRRAVESGDGIC